MAPAVETQASRVAAKSDRAKRRASQRKMASRGAGQGEQGQAEKGQAEKGQAEKGQAEKGQAETRKTPLPRRNATAKTDRSENLVPFQESALPHEHSVFAFALSLAGDRAVAEDLVQDTYLRAWRSFGTFTIGSDCRAWLFKICKNRFFDLCRRRRRRPRAEDLDTIQPTTEDLDYELRTDLERRLRGEAHDPQLLPDELVVALEELPEDFRVPILLCDLDEMPYREIASHLRIPLGTVRSRIARGRALLRRRLAAYAQELGYSLEDGGAAA